MNADLINGLVKSQINNNIYKICGFFNLDFNWWNEYSSLYKPICRCQNYFQRNQVYSSTRKKGCENGWPTSSPRKKLLFALFVSGKAIQNDMKMTFSAKIFDFLKEKCLKYTAIQFYQFLNESSLGWYMISIRNTAFRVFIAINKFYHTLLCHPVGSPTEGFGRINHNLTLSKLDS